MLYLCIGVLIGVQAYSAPSQSAAELAQTYQVPELAIDGPPVSGELTRNDPFAFYVFDIPQDGVYIIETTPVRRASLLDTLLYLFDANDVNTVLEQDDDDGAGLYSRIERRLPAGPYVIAVGGYNSALGVFQVGITRGEVLPTATPTRVIPTATPTPTQTPLPDTSTVLLTVDSGPETFEFDQPNDEITFRFSVQQVGTYILETSQPAGEEPVDTVIALYGPQSRTNLIASNDDGGEGLYSMIEARLEAGIYFLVAREYSGRQGHFQVEVSSDTAIAPTSTPTRVPTSTPTPRPTFTPTATPTPTQTPVNAVPEIRVEPDSLTFTVQGSLVTTNQVARAIPEETDYSILLNSGDLSGEVMSTGPAISPQAEQARTRYVLLQFYEIPTAAERFALADSGIHLLQYIPNNAYWAKIDDDAVSLASVPMGGGIRWAESSSRIDKLAPAVRDGVVPGHAILSDALSVFLVSVLPGVESKDAERAIEATGARVTAWKDEQSVTVTSRLEAIEAVAAIDLVEWVDFTSPPFAETNSTAARILEVNPVYNAPYNLSGAGVRVGVWDAGSIYPHRDFGNRLTQRETSPRARGDDHATHVGGSVGGAGTSNSRSRGMAPRVLIDSYDWNSDTSEMRASVRNGVRLSNHSYGFVLGWRWDPSKNDWEEANTRLFGQYTADSRDYDSVVQRQGLIVFKAAGNDRNDGPGGTQVDGPYDIIGPQAGAKNVITVGATDDSNNMSSFSCWGPTNDGRIKPDICANGVSVFSTLPGNSHGGMSGTSMASPVACGIGTLLFELFNRETGEEPDAAMIKALLIHGAVDRGRPGPDYSYGFGVVNAKESADLVLGRKWRTDKLADGQAKRFPVTVQAGQSELKATLVWTDVPGSPSSRVALVNNLDIKLISPSGQEWLPWRLDGNNPTANATRGVNSVDNVEQIEVPNPEAGVWTIEVRPTRIAQGDGDFVLICDAFGVESESDSSFLIFNDGSAPLRINAMQVQNAPWISYEPGAPLVIGPGDSSKVTVSINPAQVPGGETTRRISLFSNDTDQNPYPDGVDIITRKDAVAVPTATPPPRPTPTPQPPSVVTLSVDGTRVDSRIDQLAERDRFQFVATGTGEYLIETHAIPNRSGVDTVVHLFGPNSDTSFIATNDDGGAGTYSRLVASLQGGQTYFIEVQAYNDRTTGSYSISVTAPTTRPEPTPAPPSGVRTLRVNALPVQAEIDPAFDQDWYSFRTTVAGRYAIGTLLVNGRSAMDTVVRVYDQPSLDANLLGENDDISNTNRFSRVTLNLPANQTVYVNVSGYSRSTGVYSIVVGR